MTAGGANYLFGDTGEVRLADITSNNISFGVPEEYCEDDGTGVYQIEATVFDANGNHVGSEDPMQTALDFSEVTVGGETFTGVKMDVETGIVEWPTLLRQGYTIKFTTGKSMGDVLETLLSEVSIV